MPGPPSGRKPSFHSVNRSGNRPGARRRRYCARAGSTNVTIHPLRSDTKPDKWGLSAMPLIAMMTKSSAANAATKKKLIAGIAAAQKQADAAKKAAKLAKLEFRRARQEFKEARKAAKKLRKSVKSLKADLAALAPARPRRKAPAAKLVVKLPLPVAAPEVASPPVEPPPAPHDSPPVAPTA